MEKVLMQNNYKEPVEDALNGKQQMCTGILQITRIMLRESSRDTLP